MNQFNIGDVVTNWKGDFFRVYDKKQEQAAWQSQPYEILLCKIIMDRYWTPRKGKKLRRLSATSSRLVDKNEIQKMKQLKLEEYEQYCKGLEELEKLL